MNTNKKHLPSTLTNEEKVSENDKLLLINEDKSNNFDVKSNNEIEEMVMELAEAHHKMDVAWTNYFCDCEKFPKPKTEHLILAEHLYNAGYRKQEWISVEDRLPNKYTLVLIFVEGEIRLDYIDGYGTWHENFLYRVTHWMPLPEAPKMKGGE